jgi:hypothetical protein
LYVAHYNGATFKTFLGGGLFFSTSADVVASNSLGSIAQDIVERFDSTNTDNLREALESCLLMTDAKCNVPDPLQKEFGAKQLTLGQYLLKNNEWGAWSSVRNRKVYNPRVQLPRKISAGPSGS